MKRSYCEQCRRPVSECYCAHVPQLSSELQLLILQHPDEVAHPFNTARMVDLALPEDCQLHSSEISLQPWQSDKYLPFLLFPGESPVPIQQLHAQAAALERIPLAIVPDGTWRKAGQVVRNNDWLLQLPRVGLHLPQHSEYQVRKSNREGGIATVEACVALLQQWHEQFDGQGYETMLKPLKFLVERQKRFMPSQQQEQS